MQDLKKLFEDAISADSTWAKAYFSFGRFLDSAYTDARRRQQPALAGGSGAAGTSGREQRGQRSVTHASACWLTAYHHTAFGGCHYALGVIQHGRLPHMPS